MCKKILITLMLCVLSLSSIGFADQSTAKISVYLGESFHLESILNDQNIAISLNDQTSIQNSNPSIVSIEEFKVSSLAVGQTLLVIANNNDLCTINVEIKSPIKEILLEDKNLTLLQGEIYPLDYRIIPESAYTKKINQQLKWKSSRPNIIRIKGGYQLYTQSVGTTTLTGTTYDGSHSITIDVKVIGNPNGLVIKPTVVDNAIQVGEKRQLQAFFGTKDVTNYVKWTSNYPELMTVDTNGLVTPLREGTCEITAQSSVNRKKESYTFLIKSMVKEVSLDQSSILFDSPGAEKQLIASLTYKDPAVTPLLDGYYFESSNTTIATVTQDGLVKARGPGIALISVITNDSGKRDTCTVEVLDQAKATSNNYIPVESLELTPYSNYALIGQKTPLSFDLRPTDASDQSLRFDVKNGDISQIQLIDGQYYFIPNERGTTRIKAVANGGLDVDDEIEIIVESPIASLDLDLDTNEGTNKERKLYIGEQTLVKTDIYTQGRYTAFDVYTNTLEYSIDDPDIAKLEYLNGRYFITALKRGTTTLRIESIEGRHDDFIKIKVASPVKKLFTDREVRLPLNTSYTPRVTYTTTTSAKHKGDLNIDLGLRFEVEEFYFSTDYIDQEIAYENKVIDHFIETPYTETKASTIEKHSTRLNRLMALKDSSVNGYSLVKNNFLKDRNFKTYKYYTLNDHQLLGHYPGMAKVNIMIGDSATKATSLIHWQDNNEVFEVKPTTKWLPYDQLIDSEQLIKGLSVLSVEDQIKCAIYYLSHQSSFETIPSADLLLAMSNLDLENLPSSITKNLDDIVTKQELAFISMYLDKKANGVTPIKTDHIVFYDVIDEDVKQALAQEYLLPDSEDYLGAATHVNYGDFKSVIDRILPANKLPQTLDGDFSHRQLLLLLNQL